MRNSRQYYFVKNESDDDRKLNKHLSNKLTKHKAALSTGGILASHPAGRGGRWVDLETSARVWHGAAGDTPAGIGVGGHWSGGGGDLRRLGGNLETRCRVGHRAAGHAAASIGVGGGSRPAVIGLGVARRRGRDGDGAVGVLGQKLGSIGARTRSALNN